MDTTSRESNLALIELVADALRAHGVEPVILPSADGIKANLLATIAAHDGGTVGGVMLSGHTDVVPVDGQTWHSDPFVPVVRDGKLYGRGTCDMKSFIGVILAALPAMVKASLREPIHLAFSYDEEVGMCGAVRLMADLDRLGLAPRVCIVGEPSSMRVISGHKSINLFKLVFHGVAAHSSLTSKGTNAIEYAARAIAFIRSIADEYASQGPFDEAFEVPCTTASVNLVEGGIAGNTVADRCVFQFEFRSISAVNADELRDRIQAYCDVLQAEMQREHEKSRIEFITLAMVPGLDTDPRSDAPRLGEALGGTPSSDKVTYATEAGLFQGAGIETIVCGPGNIHQAHAPDEFIELDQIRACEAFIERLLQHLDAGVAANGIAR